MVPTRSLAAVRCRLAATIVAVLLVSGCDMLSPKAKTRRSPDFSKAHDVLEVERMVPKSRKTAYANLFGCTVDLAQKRGLPTPPMDEKYAAAIARQVMADPHADRTCFGRVREAVETAKGPRTSWDAKPSRR